MMQTCTYNIVDTRITYTTSVSYKMSHFNNSFTQFNNRISSIQRAVSDGNITKMWKESKEKFGQNCLLAKCPPPMHLLAKCPLAKCPLTKINVRWPSVRWPNGRCPNVPDSC